MSNPLAIAEAGRALRQARRVCVLTGAGVSAESGVPTFRASDGLWEGHRIEDVATPRGFTRDPVLVWKFYNARRVNVAGVEPNDGHYALADMEASGRFDSFTVATQNVDGLHKTAGSVNVHELHGSLRRTRCLGCKIVEDRGLEPLGNQPLCPRCGERLRPDIVWFEEMLPPGIWESASRAAAACDLFFVVGTSAVVYPAASLIDLAREGEQYQRIGYGATVVEINLAPTAASDKADLGVYGPSGVALPAIWEAAFPDESPE